MLKCQLQQVYSKLSAKHFFYAFDLIERFNSIFE